MTINNEYRDWLISEINNANVTDQLTVNELETIYETLGCLRTQASHSKRAVLKQLYLLDDTDWDWYY